MSSDPLSATFSALADPTRRAILARLALGESSVTDLAAPFQMSMPAVSKHLKILSECGLVKIRQEGRERYCEAKLDKLHEVSDWVGHYKKFWNEKLDRLEEYLQELQSTEKKHGNKK